MAEKIELSKDGYLKLINKVFENKLEERELSLDRYRQADEQMDSTEAFALIGKNAVSFLALASTATNDIAAIAKEIKGLIFKDSDVPEAKVSFSGDWKEQVSEFLNKKERPKAESEIPLEQAEEDEPANKSEKDKKTE
jgi:hypothetical protein